MTTFEKILAKSNPEETLTDHTNLCLTNLRKVLIWYNPFIDTVCQNYNLDKADVIKRLFLTVAFHDIGKATVEFQSKIRGDKYANKESHPLASVPLIYNAIKDRPILEVEEDKYYPECLAVISHHNKLGEHVYEGFQNNLTSYVEKEYFIQFYSNLNLQAQQNQIPEWADLRFDEYIITSRKDNYILFYDEILNPLSRALLKKQTLIRDLFILFKSVLHYCDWLASSHNENYTYAVSESLNDITHVMKSNNANFNDWANFQYKASSTDKHIFVRIPTGQGKTEASILWALNKHAEHYKIIFLLPTMVTTNKMWNRLRVFFGDERVGLMHSTAEYVIKGCFEIEPEALKVNYLYNRTFFKPVTVATVDQLIYSFFNWGYWVLTGSASYNAKIVIDEIHVYDGYTLGLLLKTIELISRYKSRFAIMSASFPAILQRKIEEILPASSFEIISEPIFEEKQRHIISLTNNVIEDVIENILSDYRQKKKVLVICNTIKKARELFDLLADIPSSDKMLYHSQFILKDKIVKEKIFDDIKNQEDGFIAICTQIVEVSLDIDFDILYTENAPIDAIIQRLGRVNRKGSKGFAPVLITKESEQSRKYIYNKDILDASFRILTDYVSELTGNLKEKHFKEIVDKVYKEENLPNEYFDAIEEGKSLISKIWKSCTKNIYTLSADERTLQNVSSRKIDYVMVECVLHCHYQTINFDELYKNHQMDKIREYTIKLPLYLARSKDYFIRQIEDSNIHLLNIAYDFDKGISMKSDDLNLI